MPQATRAQLLPLSLVLLELGTAAAALAELFACEVAVAERTTVPTGETAAAWAVLALAAAILVWASRDDDRARRLGRDLAPLLGLALVPLRIRFAGTPPGLADALLAPVALGLAAARAARALPGVPRSGTLVLVASAVFAVGLATHALSLLDGLALGYRDVGEYAARLENTLRGHFLRTRPSLPPFYDHWNPGLALLALPYAVVRPFASAPAYLTVVQAVCLAALGPIGHGLARRRLADGTAALALALALLAAPALTHLNVAASYGFHPVTPALALLAGAAWAFAAGRARVAAALTVLAWSFEETVPVATFGAGLALALDSRTRRAGLALALASLGYFLLVAKVLLPLLNGERYYQLDKFEHLGGSLGSVLLSPFLRPRAFFGALGEGASLAFVLGLLAPWALLPLGRARWVLAAGPVLLFACLRTEPRLKSIALHYHETILAWPFVGLVETARSPGALLRRGLGLSPRRRPARRALAAGALVASVAAAALFGDAPFGRARRHFGPRPGLGRSVAELASALPADAPLAATQRAAAHLVSAHPELELVGPVAPRTRFVLLDLDDGWSAPVPALHRHARDLRREGWGAVAARGHLVLLERGRAEPAAPGAPRGGPGLRSFPQAGLTLLEIVPEGETARLAWRLDHATEGDWGLVPLGPDGLAGEVSPIGPAGRPTYRRSPGETFEERRTLAPDVARLEVFDYLDLDRRGRDVIDVVAELLR